MCLVPGKTRKFLFKFVAKTEDVGKKIEVSYKMCLKNIFNDISNNEYASERISIILKFIKLKMKIFHLDLPREIIHYGFLIGLLSVGIYYT